MAQPPVAVILMNMGGPDSIEAVEPFLFNLFNDHDLIPLPLGFLWQRRFAKMVSRSRAKTVRDYYGLIGGRSPIGDITAEQAALLEKRLNAAGGRAYRCHVAMRYTPPFTDDAVARARADGAGTIVGLSLYPHYTTATTGSSLWELRRALAGKSPGAGAVDLVEVDRWPGQPTYLDALAQQVVRGLEQFPEEARAGVELLFSAHGLPETFLQKGDPYVRDLETTIAGVLKRLGGQHPWRLSFQSRAGKARWLEPSTDEVLRLLARTGRVNVLAIPISFVSDHIETLYEIDLLFGDEARALGLNFKRAPSLNTEPLFIEALAQLVEEKLGATATGAIVGG
ncbi:MAG: hemH 1 [Myxococcales bacterium]|nr:hemH 1 [Myxococcales bacterium]